MTESARLAVGDKAPAFSLPDADGTTVKLSDFKGRKVIVYFYPAASTPGCTKQACSFRDSLATLNDAGIDVVGISPDKPEKLAKFRDAEGLTFPLLSDPERTALTAWGTLAENKMYAATAPGVIDDGVDEIIEAVLGRHGRAELVPDGTLRDHQRIAFIPNRRAR